eukprot:9530236-Alexandrium_andersonii.AAC.1
MSFGVGRERLPAPGFGWPRACGELNNCCIVVPVGGLGKNTTTHVRTTRVLRTCTRTCTGSRTAPRTRTQRQHIRETTGERHTQVCTEIYPVQRGDAKSACEAIRAETS